MLAFENEISTMVDEIKDNKLDNKLLYFSKNY